MDPTSRSSAGSPPHQRAGSLLPQNGHTPTQPCCRASRRACRSICRSFCCSPLIWKWQLSRPGTAWTFSVEMDRWSAHTPAEHMTAADASLMRRQSDLDASHGQQLLFLALKFAQQLAVFAARQPLLQHLQFHFHGHAPLPRVIGTLHTQNNNLLEYTRLLAC